MKPSHLSLVLAGLFCGPSAFSETIAVESPGGHLELTFEVAADGAVTHALAVDGKPLISPSPVGFAGGRFSGVKRQAENSVWKPVWGKRSIEVSPFRSQRADEVGRDVLD